MKMDERNKDRLLVMIMGLFMFIWLTMITVALFSKTTISLDGTQVNIVSGTEYEPGETGKIVVEIRDRFSNPLEANCSVTILYPEGSVWVNDDWMNETVIGTYFYDFTVQNITGIYEYSTSCQRGSRNYVVGKSFHVSGTGLRAWTNQ